MTAGPATAQQSLPAPQWISNCIASMEAPNARRSYELLNKPPPTHAENQA